MIHYSPYHFVIFVIVLIPMLTSPLICSHAICSCAICSRTIQTAKILHTVNTYTIICATNCISYGLLRASHCRNPTGRPTSSVVAAFAPPHHTMCVRMGLTARAYSDFARSRFILIPVAFEIASGLLRALRVRRVLLRFRRAYTVSTSTRQSTKTMPSFYLIQRKKSIKAD